MLGVELGEDMAEDRSSADVPAADWPRYDLRRLCKRGLILHPEAEVESVCHVWISVVGCRWCRRVCKKRRRLAMLSRHGSLFDRSRKPASRC